MVQTAVSALETAPHLSSPEHFFVVVVVEKAMSLLNTLTICIQLMYMYTSCV